MEIALVGLPGSGKTSLFAALSGQTDVTPSHRIHEPLVATISVPDERLELLRDHYSPRKFTPASLIVLDYPGFPVDDAAEGKARFVATIREADAFAVVLSAFTRPGEGAAADPSSERQRLLEEFALGDIVLVERRIERLEKDTKRPSKTRDDDLRELAVLQRILPALFDGKTILDLGLSAGEERLLRGFRFLTAKPRLIVVNQAEGADPASASHVAESGEAWVALAATVERELAAISDPAELAECMEMMGVTETARPRLLSAAYATLGLSSFFTVGEDEVRAWTIPAGCPAVEAAGKVHSDIQRGFIRAEVVSYEDYTAAGSMKEAKARNRMRLEGKDYAVADGDIINFRFSV